MGGVPENGGFVISTDQNHYVGQHASEETLKAVAKLLGMTNKDREKQLLSETIRTITIFGPKI